MKVPFSDREESLLFPLSLVRTNIWAGQPKTRSFLKSSFSPVLNCRGAMKFNLEDGQRFLRKAECCIALPHRPLGRSAYFSIALAFAKSVQKDRSTLPFSQGCSTLEKSCFTPKVRTIHFSNSSFKNSHPRSNCQVFSLMLPFRADINCDVFLHASKVSSAVFVLSRVITTSSDISSTTVRTYLYPKKSGMFTIARSEWRCSPGFPSGFRFISFP